MDDDERTRRAKKIDAETAWARILREVPVVRRIVQDDIEHEELGEAGA